MATKIPAIIRVRRGTADQWNTENPVLQEGEIGYISSEENAGKLKVGDGINPWKNLTLTVGVATWGSINGLLSNQTDLQNELDNTNSLIVDLETIVNAWIGRGGYLEAYDFGTATPTQEELTNEALAQITTITDPVNIFNGTKIKNLNNGDVWILTNTQDTDPVVFEWTNQGPDSIQQFGLNTGGYIKGADPVSDGNGFIEATPDGKGKVIGFENINYSTEEQDTGVKWLIPGDSYGKTIYQKTFLNLAHPQLTEQARQSVGTVASMIPGATLIIDGKSFNNAGRNYYNYGISASNNVTVLSPVTTAGSQQLTTTLWYIK